MAYAGTSTRYPCYPCRIMLKRNSFSRLRITLLAAVIGFCVACSYVYFYTPKEEFNRGHFKRKDNNTAVKYILYWNPEFNSKATFKDPYKRFKCEYNQCTVFTDTKAIKEADAVIFSGQNLFHVPEKIRGQIWIFTTAESPNNFPNSLSPFKNMFNWTWTYRRDSDILRMYGKIQPITNRTWKQQKPFHGKSGDILWFVSNCVTPSKRHLYVKQMQKFSNVDIYGKCSTRKCTRGSLKCKSMFNDFKYYLAFENSLCRDYITEKYFDILHYDTIPVVRGGANYTLYHPDGKIIDTANFESAEKLVEYLKLVGSKESVYSSFSEWKERFESTNHNPWCELCKRVQKQENYKRLYHDIELWWKGSTETGGKMCHS